MAIPLGGFFPSLAVWKCRQALDTAGVLREMHCVDSPECSSSSSDVCVRTQLLSVQCSGRAHHLRVQEGSNTVDAGGKWRSGHVNLTLGLARAHIMS